MTSFQTQSYSDIFEGDNVQRKIEQSYNTFQNKITSDINDAKDEDFNYQITIRNLNQPIPIGTDDDDDELMMVLLINRYAVELKKIQKATIKNINITISLELPDKILEKD